MYRSRVEQILQLSHEEIHRRNLKAKQSLVDQWLASSSKAMDVGVRRDEVVGTVEKCAQKRTRKRTTLGRCYDEEQGRRKWKNKQELAVQGRIEDSGQKVGDIAMGVEDQHMKLRRRKTFMKSLKIQHQETDLKHHGKRMKMEAEVRTLEEESVGIETAVEYNQHHIQKDRNKVNVSITGADTNGKGDETSREDFNMSLIIQDQMEC